MISDKSIDVFVVDPDDAVRDGIKTLLHSYGLKVRKYRDGQSFLKDVMNDQPLGCVLIERELLDANGLELLKKLRRAQAVGPVVIMTSDPGGGFVDRALRNGADAVFPKPLNSAVLLEWLESNLARVSGIADNKKK